MIPASFPETNLTLSPPKGISEDEVSSLRVYQNEKEIISRWRPTQDEIDDLQAGGSVWLRVWCNGMPPVHLGTESPFEE